MHTANKNNRQHTQRSKNDCQKDWKNKIERRGAPVGLQHKAKREGELSQIDYKHKYSQVLLQYRQP